MFSDGRPPHGGRGLKLLWMVIFAIVAGSPSPRRAWIEILSNIASGIGSVCRPPHGGRGLKSYLILLKIFTASVALPTEGVD